MKRKPKQFNWLTFLKAAIKKEPSEAQWKMVWEKSKQWPTCACGQLCREVPRNVLGSPEDRTLHELGLNFGEDVYWRNWPVALETFNKIEKRTAELLNK